MSPKTTSNPAVLVQDPGVLGPTPTLEVFGFDAVAAVGGITVIPLRSDWLQAREVGIEAVSGWNDVPNDSNRFGLFLEK